MTYEGRIYFGLSFQKISPSWQWRHASVGSQDAASSTHKQRAERELEMKWDFRHSKPAAPSDVLLSKTLSPKGPVASSTSTNWGPNVGDISQSNHHRTLSPNPIILNVKFEDMNWEGGKLETFSL